MPDADDFDLQPRTVTRAELAAIDWGLGAGILPQSYLVHLVDTDADELRLGDGATYLGCPYGQGMQAGRFRADSLFGTPYGTTIVSAFQPAANTIYANFCPLPRRASVAKLVVEVQASEASVGFRVGIYRDSNGQPGRLVADCGTTGLGTTGTKSPAANLPKVLGSGAYWLCYVTNATGTARVNGWPTTAFGGLGWAASGYARTTHLQRAFTYGAFPADESGATYTLQSGSSPAVYFGF